MKKRALRKDFYIEIKRSLGRFLSIFFIVALGVSFFAGIRAAEPDMRLSGDEYFDEHCLADMKIISTMGLTESDVKALEDIDGVQKAEYGYSVDAMCRIDDTKKVVHVMSDLKEMNRVLVDEGRMPEKENECFMDIDFLKESGYKVGDEIELESGTEDPLTDSLKSETLKIVGAGSSPCYISFERGSSTIGTGEVSGFLVVSENAFSMDTYTEIYLQVDGAFDQVAFTKAYASKVDDIVEKAEAIKDERAKARRDGIVFEAEEELADAEAELAEGKQELADAKKELEDGRKELEDGRKELEDGKKELEKGQKELEDGKKELANAKKKADAELLQARKKLENGERELNTGKKELQNGKKELSDAKAVLETKQEELNAAKAQYEDGLVKLNAGKAEFAAGEEEFNKQVEFANGAIVQLEAGIEEAKGGIAVLDGEIKKAEAGLAAIESNYAVVKESYEKALEEFESGSDIVTEAELNVLKENLMILEEKKAEISAGLTILNEQYGKAQATLSGLETQLKTIKSELAAGQKKIDDARAELIASENELNAAKTQIDSGQQQLDNGFGEISANEKKLANVESTIASSEKEIASGWKEYESGKAKAAKEIANGEKELAKGEKELADAKKEIADAEIEIADGEKELLDGEKEIADAEIEIADGEQEIADARKDIEEIGMPKWYVYDRDVFTQYTGYGDNADRMRAIGEVFPVLFFLVAALISLTTMTRMVEEQRTQIGTLKALGYSKFSIAGKYLGYAFVATLGGSIVGVLAGEKLYPYIIVTAYKIMYPHLPNVVIPYNMTYAVMATGAAIACTMAATIFSCYKELAAQPAVLMRPPAPKQGKRVFLEKVPFIWKHLSFIWKSTIRNLIRYKKRFFMTVFGIGGCMALILVGYGLRDSIFNIAVIQYEDIQTYNIMAIMDEDATEEEKAALTEYIDNETAISDMLDIYMKNMTIGKGNQEEEAYIFVTSDEGKFKDFVNLQDRRTKEGYELTDDGAVLTEKMARTLGVEAGDSIYIKDEDSGEKEVKITAVCENYMGHYLYMTETAYEALYADAANYNTKLFKMGDYSEEKAMKIGEDMLLTKAAINVQYMDSMRGRIEDMLSTLDSVIIVLITAAGMLAFVVLYNLNNINITERRRELATIKVLGFYDKEVAAYVYRENILLTIIGAAAGCGLGYLLHQFVIVTVEVDDVMFGRNIDLKSYIIAMLFTIGFSAFVNWVMYFKLKKINMVESLKSVE